MTENFNRPRTTSRKKAPNVLMAPASEGEKIPKYKHPMIRKNINSIPQIPFKDLNFSFQVEGSPGGPRLRFLMHMISMTAENIKQSIKPGNAGDE